MKVVFMGSPEFAVPCLDAVLAGGHEVPLVVSQPDRPAGRGRQLAPTAVKAAAEARGLSVATQDRGRAERLRIEDLVAAADPDVVVVVAYGHILREPLLSAPRLGCVNVHFSLLPRWRGVSPVQHALLHGDQWTGVTLIRMDAGIDTGPVVATTATPIDPRESAGALLQRLCELGAALLQDTLARLAASPIAGVPQDDRGAVYAPRLTRVLAPVRWQRDAVTVHNQIRALQPVPGTTSCLGDRVLKICRAEPVGLHASGAPGGTVLSVGDDGIEVACGEGSVRLLELQAPGRRPLSAAEFRRGFSIEPGQVFTS